MHFSNFNLFVKAVNNGPSGPRGPNAVRLVVAVFKPDRDIVMAALPVLAGV